MIEEVEGAVENLVKSEAESLKKGEHSKTMEKSASAGSASESSTSAEKSSSHDTNAQKGEGVAVPKTMDAAQGGLKKGADDPAADASPDALPSEGEGEPAAAGSDPAAAAAPADPAAPAPGAESAPSEQDLVEAYGQLSPEELQMHMQAMQQVMQTQSAGAAPAGAPPADPMASAAPAPDASAAPAPMPGADSQPVAPAFAKSEAGLKIAALEKSLEATLQVLQVMTQKPSFKSVDALDTVTKTEAKFESLSKAEVTERLNKAVRGDLGSGDRNLVKKFYKGEAGVRDIAHLLAK